MSGPDQYPPPGAPPPEPGETQPYGVVPAGPPPGGTPYGSPPPGATPGTPYGAPAHGAPGYGAPAYGAPAYGAPPPGYGPPAAGFPGPAPGYPGPHAPLQLGAAHKPGAIPLRPLALGDIYDAAFKIIRLNPKATVGSSVLVATVSMAIPVIMTAVLTFALDLSLDPEQSQPMSRSEALGLLGVLGSLGIGVILASLGQILVTGMIARVVGAAVIGRKATLGEAWAMTHGRRWRLIGLSAVLGLMTFLLIAVYLATWVGIAALGDWRIAVAYLLSIPLFVVAMAWFWIRVYYLPVPVLMLEPVGIFGAIRRGYRLTGKPAFWKTLGIALLTLVIAQTAGSILAVPFALLPTLGTLAGAGEQYYMMLVILGQSLSTIVTAAFVAPFSGSVVALQYIDQRIRREAFDVELMSQAGITRA